MTIRLLIPNSDSVFILATTCLYARLDIIYSSHFYNQNVCAIFSFFPPYIFKSCEFYLSVTLFLSGGGRMKVCSQFAILSGTARKPLLLLLLLRLPAPFSYLPSDTKLGKVSRSRGWFCKLVKYPLGNSTRRNPVHTYCVYPRDYFH